MVSVPILTFEKCHLASFLILMFNCKYCNYALFTVCLATSYLHCSVHNQAPYFSVSNSLSGSEVPKVAWKSREIKLKQNTIYKVVLCGGYREPFELSVRD